MLVLNEVFEPIDRVSSIVFKHVEQERMTKIIRLFGKLVAYLPHNRRAYYNWLLILSYRPAQAISVYQFSPPHLRVVLLSRWEFGLILGSWSLGLRLRQPLAWFKRLQPA